MLKVRFSLALLACALTGQCTTSSAIIFQESFGNSPSADHWRVHGDDSLFRWNQNNQNLEVTWDSSRPNSYYYHPLGTILGRNDDFSFSFDLRIQDMATGTTPGKPKGFEIAVGLLNFQSATNAAFLRGTGYTSPNLVEFDYFPDLGDLGYGSTIVATMIDRVNNFSSGGFLYQDLATNTLYRVTLSYAASNQTAYLGITTNDVVVTETQANMGAAFTDFRVDAFAIPSYNDDGQDPLWSGSIRAHGVIDNVVITTPPAPIAELTGSFSNQVWVAQFLSSTNFSYRLEASQDLRNWTSIATATGTGGSMSLQDAALATTNKFYRVVAERP